MQETEQRLAELRKRVQDLAKYQDYFAREMVEIRRLMASLETPSATPAEPTAATATDQRSVYFPPPTRPRPVSPIDESAPPLFQTVPDPETRSDSSNLEKFIGENLIAMVGAVITVIGVAIGAKYAIDKGWITPVMRIVFGYLIGIGLLIPAFRLREKMSRFSAVTLSGSMAIFYFVTYAAYSFYDLIPQPFAFALLVLFTAFTVFAAIRYERVVIAHIGMVGAYAVPFLLSQNEGRIAFLFTYISVINAGILAVSIKRYWRSIFYTSFVITWMIFFAWFNGGYSPQNDLGLSLGFSAAFFAIFYATFLAWKLIAHEPFGPENVALVLANSFIFFGVGYSTLSDQEQYRNYLGLFTLANAAIHFAVAVFIFRFAATAPSVITLIIGLVITFLTIAVPVQLNGHWITLVWIAEAIVLFSIGRIKRISLYEWFSYPLMLIGTLALFVDWAEASSFFGLNAVEPIYPMLNVGFLTSLFYVAGGALILWLDGKHREGSVLPVSLVAVFRFAGAAAATFALYNALRMEIGNFWDLRQAATMLDAAPTGPYSRGGNISDPSIPYWNAITQIDYSLLFVAVALVVNGKYFRSRATAFAGVVCSGLFFLVFVTAGFAVLTELRELYLRPAEAAFAGDAGSIAVRYVSYAIVGLLLFALAALVRDEELSTLPGAVRKIGFDALLHLVALACLSSEILNLTDIFGIPESEKLGLSILWGIYALFLILIGIGRSKKHLRIQRPRAVRDHACKIVLLRSGRSRDDLENDRLRFARHFAFDRRLSLQQVPRRYFQVR
ncbi:MAG: DUF2339 domain-containing protein [Acidobacteria bacterium]|nr:DUF2339 domain-containing protein [Acidobacteriota bacterium]